VLSSIYGGTRMGLPNFRAPMAYGIATPTTSRESA